MVFYPPRSNTEAQPALAASLTVAGGGARGASVCSSVLGDRSPIVRFVPTRFQRLNPDKVSCWWRRCTNQGLQGIEKERPQRGRCPKAQAALRAEIILRKARARPPNATHCSCRSMAKAIGTTHRFGKAVWRPVGPKPHLWVPRRTGVGY